MLYDKVSSAALALQEMNGAALPGHTKHIKVRLVFKYIYIYIYMQDIFFKFSLSLYFMFVLCDMWSYLEPMHSFHLYCYTMICIGFRYFSPKTVIRKLMNL